MWVLQHSFSAKETGDDGGFNDVVGVVSPASSSAMLQGGCSVKGCPSALQFVKCCGCVRAPTDPDEMCFS